MTKEYEQYYLKVNAGLREAIKRETFDFLPGQRPQSLVEAMNYSLLAEGKRIRPVMLLASYHLVREDWEKALPYALALEMIHTYSLIHDDLPAMDNDDYRRGKLTSHKVFGEANAILAGDGLLNTAYEMLFEACAQNPGLASVQAGRIIAQAAGAKGMVGGQAVDIFQEGKPGGEKVLNYIQQHKTSALFMAAMEAGVCLAGGDGNQQKLARNFGYHYGMAFQMVDDLLDIQGDAALLGKSTGKDMKQGKLTWPSLIGLDHTKIRAEEHVQKAIQSLKSFGSQSKFLIELAQSALKRVQ